MIHTFKPKYTEAEISAVERVMRSGWTITGPEVKAFEEEFAEKHKVKYAIATASCTHALQLAYMTLIPEESEVFTTPTTFTATLNSMMWANLKPRFVDVDEHGNMFQPPIHAKYVVPVHFGGRPLEWIPEDYMTVIYDCAHACGGMNIFGGLVGSYGHANAFSFHVSKCMNTFQGGMLTTNDPEVNRRARYLRIHGMTKDAYQRGQEQTPHHDVAELGIKANMTDIQAAVGREQLKRLDLMREQRTENAMFYQASFAGQSKLERPEIVAGHTWHLYMVKVVPELQAKRDEIIQKCSQRGIELCVHGKPVYLHTAYQALLGNLRGTCPSAEDLYARSMTLPNYPGMTDEERTKVVEVLTGVLSEY